MTASPKDIAVLKAWNRTAPDNAGTCVHTLLDRQCRGQPEAAAVCSASGTLSYGELAQLSSQLAVHLTNKHSQWTTVAMLAVSKAGAAFVLPSPSYPSPRLQEICTLVRADLILYSQQHTAKAQHLASAVVSVDAEDGHNWRSHLVDQLRSTVQPSNALYAAFTSGSSGKPKGIVTQHDSLCTSALVYIKAGGLNAQMRALQFSSLVNRAVSFCILN
ncbi:hypothetical protein IFM47457_11340 [Aspergillus lentulus]|uniref:AMP-dependent synthetase/ligase domain-containing protein n=1 Tax=Aspergillus lentulus TaxID=293939 RepID=A0ABQ1B615_ASPLE|nr:hypothetical protein CNMCM7927_004677 [Aspergillus lentulus]GFF94431.1 hypothetical protein IFM60648_10404 [Aspergillus lentulus]GFF97338.1 hypothetical protein IFM47457_11340 [Aspergillus lentulus]